MLEQIVGHPQVHRHFRRVLTESELAPVYLFVGPRGVGKSSFAQALARAVLCLDHPGKGCAGCASCHKVLAGTHPDLRVVAPAAEEVFSIGMVRELREQVQLAPWESNVRVFVLEDIERMPVEAANSLLKTLEEPPSYVRLVLIAESMGAVLPTIESRCQLVRFGPLSDEAMLLALTRRGMSEPEARLLAGVSGGSLGDALAEEAGVLACRARMFDIWESGTTAGAAGRQLTQLMADLSTPEARQVAKQTLDLLAGLIRDRIAERLGVSKWLNSDLTSEQLGRLPGDVEWLLERMDSLEDLRVAVDSNVSPRTVVEDAGQLLGRGCAG